MPSPSGVVQGELEIKTVQLYVADIASANFGVRDTTIRAKGITFLNIDSKLNGRRLTKKDG
jgi:hypothetical protein